MKVLMMVTMMLVGLNAHANYVKGGLGYSIAGKAKLSGPGGSASGSLDNSFINPLLVAYGFPLTPNLMGEAEVSYRNVEQDNDKVKIITGAFNVVGNFPQGAATLNLGAGATFGTYNVDISGASSGTALGLQVFGGADFDVAPDVKIGGELRYMTTISDVDIGHSVNMSLNNTSLLFTAKFAMK